MSQTIIDFKKPVTDYHIVTDSTERMLGKSAAGLSWQNGIREMRHVFFAHLCPQPNGAAFASVMFPITKPNLFSETSRLVIHVRSLDEQPLTYQLIVKTPMADAKQFSYQARFIPRPDIKETFVFHAEDFHAVRRGESYVASPLAWDAINAIGIRIIGRESKQQKGLSALTLYSIAVE